jgi:hypothetical protein
MCSQVVVRKKNKLEFNKGYEKSMIPDIYDKKIYIRVPWLNGK